MEWKWCWSCLACSSKVCVVRLTAARATRDTTRVRGISDQVSRRRHASVAREASNVPMFAPMSSANRTIASSPRNLQQLQLQLRSRLRTWSCFLHRWFSLSPRQYRGQASDVGQLVPFNT